MGEYEQAAAHNLKSWALNLVSILVFACPLVAYFAYDVMVTYYGLAVVVVTAVTLLIPPLGWKRPHPYSDQPSNRTTKGGPPTKKAE